MKKHRNIVDQVVGGGGGDGIISQVAEGKSKLTVKSNSSWPE